MISEKGAVLITLDLLNGYENELAIDPAKIKCRKSNAGNYMIDLVTDDPLLGLEAVVTPDGSIINLDFSGPKAKESRHMHAKMLAKIRQRLASAKQIGFDKLTMLRRIYLEYPDLEEQDCHIYRKGKDKMRYDFQSCQLLVKATGELSLLAKRQIEPLQYVRQRLGRIKINGLAPLTAWEDEMQLTIEAIAEPEAKFRLRESRFKIAKSSDPRLLDDALANLKDDLVENIVPQDYGEAELLKMTAEFLSQSKDLLTGLEKAWPLLDTEAAKQMITPERLKRWICYQLLDQERLISFFKQSAELKAGKCRLSRGRIYLQFPVQPEQFQLLDSLTQEQARIMADYFQDFANWEHAEPCSYVDLDLASGQFELAPEKVKMLENFEQTLRKCSQYQEFLDCCSADGLQAASRYLKAKDQIQVTATGKSGKAYQVTFALDEQAVDSCQAFLTRCLSEEASWETKIAKQLSEHKLLGDIVAVAIAKLAMTNEYRITAKNVVKILRDLSIDFYDDLHPTAYDKHFRLFSNQMIESRIKQMLKSGLIAAEDRCLLSYRIYYQELVPSSLTESFIQQSLASKDGERETDFKLWHELVNLPDELASADALLMLKRLIDHPAVFCMAEEECAAFLQGNRTVCRKYLTPAITLEDDPFKKKYLRQLLAKCRLVKQETATEKEAKSFI